MVFTNSHFRGMPSTLAMAVLLAFPLVLSHEVAWGAEPVLDGKFDDWGDSKPAWEETGGVVRQPSGAGRFDDIDLKQFYYKSDGKWLYLFFKCEPSVAKRYSVLGASGNLAYLYIDSDGSPRTGATRTDAASRNRAMLGSDYKLWVPIGAGVEVKNMQTTRFCSVSYSLAQWNGRENKFVARADHGSRDENPRIAHGKDGVEMAILLSDIGKKKGDRFDFICVEWANNKAEFANRISIKID